MGKKENVLYIPIQINGGDSLPSTLKERELFVKLTGDAGKKELDGLLYVGDHENAKRYIPISTEQSMEAFKLHENDYFELDSRKPTESHIAGLKFDNGTRCLRGSAEKGKHSCIKNIELSQLLGVTLKKTAMYGTNLPSGKFAEGQLYFRIN